MTSSSPPIRHDPGTGPLLVDVIGDVAVVTFNNPRRHNALSGEMRAALPAVLGALQADSAVHAVVLTGAGDKASSRAPTSPSSPSGAPLPPPGPSTTGAGRR